MPTELPRWNGGVRAAAVAWTRPGPVLCHHGGRDRRRARPEPRGGRAGLTGARAPRGTRSPRVQLPLVLVARRPGALPRRRTRPLGAHGLQPRPPAARGLDGRAPARRGRRRAHRARRGGRARHRRRDGGARRRPPGGDGLLLRGVRRPCIAADLLAAVSARWPATSSRRPPTRPPRSRPSASSTGRATSASASTRRACSTSTGSTPIRGGCRRRSSPATTARRSPSPCRSTAPISSRRCGGSTSAASRSSCSTPTGPRTRSAPAGPPRASTRATPRSASRSTCSWGSVA